MRDKDGNLLVTKANAFVQNYKMPLTLAEVRIINYLIANIRSPKYDKEFRKFRFDIKEFCDIVYPDKKQGDVYTWLPNVIKALSDKSAWKEVPSTERPGKMKKVLIRWIERPTFEEGYVTMELNPELAPYLLELDSAYFQAQFKYTAEAQSKYTIPLYELLKSWEKVKDGIITFEIDELRAHMDAMKKSQNNYAEFKRTALNLAVTEINKITDLTVSYREIRRGRKVTHVEFTIGHKASPADGDTAATPAAGSHRINSRASFEYKDPVNAHLAEAVNFEFPEEDIEVIRDELDKLVECNIFEESPAELLDRKYFFLKTLYVQFERAAKSKVRKGEKDIQNRFQYFLRMLKNSDPVPAPHKPSYDLEEIEKSYDLFGSD